MEGLVGSNLLADQSVDEDSELPKDNSKFLSAKKAMEFVQANYGPSAAMIEQEIEKLNKSEGQTRDLTVEEVQRIKELVSRVGSLEFRMLANSVDDHDGQKDSADYVNDPANQQELDQRDGMGGDGLPQRERDHRRQLVLTHNRTGQPSRTVRISSARTTHRKGPLRRGSIGRSDARD